MAVSGLSIGIFKLQCWNCVTTCSYKGPIHSSLNQLSNTYLGRALRFAHTLASVHRDKSLGCQVLYLEAGGYF